MAINRTCDFYTQMGPGDVILSGFFDRNPDAPGPPVFPAEGMRVTPRTCAIEETVDATGNVVYRLTLPGAGELRVAGICVAFAPDPDDISTTQVEWAKWDYNDADRTFYIELRNAGGAGASTLQLQLNERVYFTVHVYQSGSAPITQRVEVV